MEAKPGDAMKTGEEGEVQNQMESLAEQVGMSQTAVPHQAGGGSCDLGMFQLWNSHSSTTTPRTTAANFPPNQLTIFYGGSVSVFDSMPADKVREIMLIAVAAAAKQNDVKSTGNYFPPSSPVLTRSPSLQSTATALASPKPQMYPIQNNPLCKLQAELPIARRHSLQRFFEKRRDRLVNKAPYPTKVIESKDTNIGTVASPGADCFEKQQEENQLKAAVQIA